MDFREALQWLEHWIVVEIRQPGVRQRAMLALDAVKQYIANAEKEKNDRPQHPDQRKGRR